jgi:hypothetical protein
LRPLLCHAHWQVSVVPGGVFRWGPNALEIKCDGPAGSCPTTDGWQLLGPLQHDDTGVGLISSARA